MKRKIIFGSALLISFLTISTMSSKYVFIKDAHIDSNGTVDVKERTFYDILLQAGYNDAKCVVQDGSGNEISLADVKKFFIEDEDVTDSFNNHFVKLKKYYISMSQDTSGGEDDGVITYKLASEPVDETFFLCPYFYDKNGNEISYAYYGKYKGSISDNKLCSKSGVSGAYSTTISDFRTYARANGDQYHQTDWCAVFTAQIMFMCAYKTTNASNVFTYRSYGNTGAVANDELILGIEDIVGLRKEFVDGVVFRGSGSSYAGSTISWGDNISKYENSITDNQMTLTDVSCSEDGGYISKMNYVSGKPILSFLPKEASGEASTYYCDYFTYGKTQNTEYILTWGAAAVGEKFGIFTISADSSSTKKYYVVGSRLHCKVLG